MNTLDVEILSYSSLEPEYDDDVRLAEGKMTIQIEDNLTLDGKVRRFTAVATCQVLIAQDEVDASWSLASMTVDQYDFKYFDKSDTVITAEEESILANHLDSTYEEQYRQLEILVQEDVRM